MGDYETDRYNRLDLQLRQAQAEIRRLQEQLATCTCQERS